MKFIADFHIHSHFSIATSKQLTPQYLDYWAKIKGVNVVGTGDFTHPGWTAELRNFVEPAEQGLFKLKQEHVIQENPLKDRMMRFMLSAEISNIYKKNGKVRKVHNVVLAPDFQTVDKIQKELQRRKFNITSDGRPILGLDSRDLFELLLEINDEIVLIPAHIWTPWFAALGSKSGFDTIEECYGDLTKHIFAVETGLSSDQPLNWLCSFLDKFTLLSNSDAHSPEKLGRNANIFNSELSFPAIINAMKHQEKNEFLGTIDMYPQEGKYHFDGHRKCGICYNPTQTMEHAGICPVCEKPLVLGVAHRIAQLADRDNPEKRPIKKDFKYLIPLKEIIGEIFGVKSGGKHVNNAYFKLIQSIGSELDILLNKDISEIRHFGGEFLSTAIDRMRKNEVFIKEGFDGEFGVIKLFEKNEIKNYGSKKSLFDVQGDFINTKKEKRPLLNFDVAKFLELKETTILKTENKTNKKKKSGNEEQEEAINLEQGNALVVAGPGTGKTFVLTKRIAVLIQKQKIEPEKILAITFSRHAALEMKQRIENLLNKKLSEKIKITTFHALGFDFLKQKNSDLIIINEKEKRRILKDIGIQNKQIAHFSNAISFYKNSLKFQLPEKEVMFFLEKYNNYLKENSLVDFDDLIFLMNKENVNFKEINDFEHILVDEFQDINIVQYNFLKFLTNKNTKIFAIGDPNQAIYSFRGSDLSIIDKYIADYSATILSLSKSFRCTDNILNASQSIVGNPNKLTGLSKGIKINISEQATEKSEAEFIARTIEDMIGGLRFFSMDSNVTKGAENKDIDSLSNFAVLVRTKSQFEVIQKAFENHSVPVQIIGNKSFYNESPFNELTTILKHFTHRENDFFTSQSQNILHEDFDIESLTVAEIIDKIWNSIFAEKFAAKTDELNIYKQNAEKLNLSDFLAEIEMKSANDDFNPNIEAVNLMTLHASKGLEFKCVFIPGLEDSILPYTLFNKQTDIDEERRLLYVGMTRAKKYLYFSYSKSRKIKNMHYNLKRSRFLDDIETNLLKKNNQSIKHKPKDNQLDLFD